MSACGVTVWKGRLGASFSCFLGPVAAASYACICNLKLAGGWCGWSGWTLVVSLKAELELPKAELELGQQELGSI